MRGGRRVRRARKGKSESVENVNVPLIHVDVGAIACTPDDDDEWDRASRGLFKILQCMPGETVYFQGGYPAVRPIEVSVCALPNTAPLFCPSSGFHVMVRIDLAEIQSRLSTQTSVTPGSEGSVKGVLLKSPPCHVSVNGYKEVIDMNPHDTIVESGTGERITGGGDGLQFDDYFEYSIIPGVLDGNTATWRDPQGFHPADPADACMMNPEIPMGLCVAGFAGLSWSMSCKTLTQPGQEALTHPMLPKCFVATVMLVDSGTGRVVQVVRKFLRSFFVLGAADFMHYTLTYGPPGRVPVKNHDLLAATVFGAQGLSGLTHPMFTNVRSFLFYLYTDYSHFLTLCVRFGMITSHTLDLLFTIEIHGFLEAFVQEFTLEPHACMQYWKEKTLELATFIVSAQSQSHRELPGVPTA